MFEGFTQQTRMVVIQAQSEASQLGDDQIGAEHLLLAALDDGEGTSARVFDSLGLGHGSLLQALPVGQDQKRRSRRQLRHEGGAPFTTAARQVLETARRASHSRDDRRIRPEHLVLAILDLPEGRAARALAALDAQPQVVKGRLLEAMSDRPRGQGREPGRLGGLLSEQPVLIRESNLVAYITDIHVYPTGFAFTAFTGDATERPDRYMTEPRLSVVFADGQFFSDDPGTAEGYLLSTDRQSCTEAGRSIYQTDYWVPILPTSGPVTFSVLIGESSGEASIDSERFVAAADASVDLWQPPTPDPRGKGPPKGCRSQNLPLCPSWVHGRGRAPDGTIWATLVG